MDDLRRRLSRILDAVRGPNSPAAAGEGKGTRAMAGPSCPSRSPEMGSRPQQVIPISGIAELIGGEESRTPLGPCLEARASYRLEYRHGTLRLRDFLDLDLARLDRICGGSGQGLLPEEVLFLDLETTGLSLGVGTWVFLAGFGFFRRGKYQTVQLFLRNFEEEPAFLYRARRLIEGFRAVVTFNGKRFDLPLLEGRYAFHRQENPIASLLHWDLLYPVRRLWRGRLGDCRLDTVEWERLGVRREEDEIRGDRIPEAYLRFIHSGDALFVRRIVHHNATDLLTLAVLAAQVQKCWEEMDPREANLLSVGRYLERTGCREDGIKCYRIASRHGQTREEKERALLLLAQRMKREGNWNEALEAWEMLADEGHVWAAAACEELAKHHEHRSKDLAKAVYYAEKGLKDGVFLDRGTRSRLERRLSRLGKKMERLCCK